MKLEYLLEIFLHYNFKVIWLNLLFLNLLFIDFVGYFIYFKILIL